MPEQDTPQEQPEYRLKGFHTQAAYDEGRTVERYSEPIIPTGSNSVKPEFIIEGELTSKETRAVHALKAANVTKPRLFMYLSTVSKIDTDGDENTIIVQLNRASMRHELSNAATFLAYRTNKGKLTLVHIDPPKDLAEQLLELSPTVWNLPSLKGLINTPVLRPDGTILDTPGYDETTKLYYAPTSGMEHCKIPANPTQADAIAALDRLLPLFVDFPFEGNADRANMFALLLTPFVRHAIKKDVQMALIDATNAGTGKGLLAIVVAIIAMGRPAAPMHAKEDNAEWRKAILTELLLGPTIIFIDNVRGILESAALEAAITASQEGFNERILGLSKSAAPKSAATWICTGNNLLIGGDLPRRCYRIRLIAQQHNPDERPLSSYAIPQLEDYAYEHRAEIVADILTIARAWYVAGKPRSTNVPSLGSFTDWAKTVGGMLEFAGMPDFQQNRAELRSRNSEEAAEWEAFLSVWQETYGTDWKSSGEIITDMLLPDNSNIFEPPAKHLFETLPKFLKKAQAEHPKSFAVTLAIALGKRVQTVYGSDGFRLENDWNKGDKKWVWRVVRVVAGGSTPLRSENIKGQNRRIGGGGENHPQPPVTFKIDQNDAPADSVSDGFRSQVNGSESPEAKIEVTGGCEKVGTDTQPTEPVECEGLTDELSSVFLDAPVEQAAEV